MRMQRCKLCKDSYCYDDYGPVKECSCNIKPSEPHRITHKIRQMVDEVTQSHIDEPSRSYVDIVNLEAILKYVAENEDG
jgi:hypothetical protein